MPEHVPPLLQPETEAKLARSKMRWWRVIGVCTVATTALMLGGLYVLLNNSDEAKDQRDRQLAQGAQVQALATLLVECTTRPDLRQPPVAPEDLPADDCYRRQQAATGDLVGDPKGPINTVAVAAAACGSAHPGDVPATLRCTRAAVASATG